MAYTGGSDSGQIGNLVRSWLHYDNLASSLYKQATRARQMRDQFEERIILHLRSAGMENAIIQINGGTLNVVEEKNPKTLSLTRIEELLHGYFIKRGGRDETGEIMSYLRSHRGIEIFKKLKKNGLPQSTLPPLPAPGSS